MKSHLLGVALLLVGATSFGGDALLLAQAPGRSGFKQSGGQPAGQPGDESGRPGQEERKRGEGEAAGEPRRPPDCPPPGERFSAKGQPLAPPADPRCPTGR